MYNRYIPQPDGSFRRKQVPDTRPAPPEPAPCTRENPPERPPEPPREPLCQPCEQEPPKSAPCSRGQQQNPGTFLRNLLPRDFDTGDLLIILLLLIMAGDCEDGQNNALLTLALYLFM